MESFGEELRREREARGISLEALAAETRIKVEHLHALEEERYRELPGGVFRRGIVQAYVGALGADAALWVDRFTASYAEHMQRSGERHLQGDAGWAAFAENIKRNRPATGPRHGIRWMGVVLLLLLVSLAAWAVWRFLLHGKLPNS